MTDRQHIADAIITIINDRYPYLAHVYKDPVNLFDALDKIQKEHEINFEISCFFDEGFRAKVGDKVNGYTYESALCDTFQEAAHDLIDEVERRMGEI